MSNVNIKRAVENIRTGTNPYMPIVEVVVNAIQAIESLGVSDGIVDIEIIRSRQIEIELASHIPEVQGFTITDNGIGFNAENREAFDTLYTDQKIMEGGKGFGRFTCLKYFKDVWIDSVYYDEDSYKSRKFKMGKETDIIVGESVSPTEAKKTRSTIKLISPIKPFPDKNISAIAKTLVEKLLPYFIDEDRKCPNIMLRETDNTDSVLLNDYIYSSTEVSLKLYPIESRDHA